MSVKLIMMPTVILCVVIRIAGHTILTMTSIRTGFSASLVHLKSHNSVVCSKEACSNDPESDVDKDKICGDIDSCPKDKENDADGDKLCADKHFCDYGKETGADGNKLCGDVDSCPRDK